MSPSTSPKIIAGRPCGSNALKKTPARLECLPEELLSNIAARLGCDDICAFRRTCRDVEAKTFHDFAHEHFSEKCFMVTTESLKVLVAIANDHRLRTYLRRVHIITALFSENALKCPHGCACAAEPTTRQWEAHISYVRDQKHLIKSGEALHLVTQAFKKLHKMNLLSVVDGYEHIEPTVDCRGRNKVWRTTRINPSLAPQSHGRVDYPGARAEYARWRTVVWNVALNALALSGNTSLEILMANFHDPSNGLSIKSDFPIEEQIQETLRRALQNLKALDLSVQGNANSLITRDKLVDFEASIQVVKEFAALLPPIERLALSYEPKAATGLIHSTLLMSMDLRKISSFRVDGLHIKSKRLAPTLAAMPVVKILKIGFVNLLEGSWVSIIHVLQRIPTLQQLQLLYLLEGGSKAYFLKQPEHPDDWEDEGALAAEVNHSLGIEDDESKLPELELTAPTTTPAVQINATGNASQNTPAPHTKALDFKAPGHENFPERGYFICLDSAEAISRYLPRFIQEYNVGELADDLAVGMPFPLVPTAMQSGPGNPPVAGQDPFATFLNSFAAAFGPPLAGPPGVSTSGQTSSINNTQTTPSQGLGAAQSAGQGTSQAPSGSSHPALTSPIPYHSVYGGFEPSASTGNGAAQSLAAASSVQQTQAAAATTNTVPAPGSLADLVAQSTAPSSSAAAIHNNPGVASLVTTTAVNGSTAHNDGDDGSWLFEDETEDEDED